MRKITTEGNDINQLHPMVGKAQENITALELTGQELKAVLEDAGYCSETNLEKIGLKKRPEHLIATQKDWKQRQTLAKAPPAQGRIPDVFPYGIGWSGNY